MSWDWEKLKEQREKFQGSSNKDQDKDKRTPNFDNFNFFNSNFFKGFKKLKQASIILILLALFFIFFGSSMFYTVAVDEVGVVQRFGKYTRLAQPGLNFKMPAGIEKVTTVKVQRVSKEEFGFTDKSIVNSEENDSISLMLTGDLNVAVVPWIVQYKINNPYNYLFKVKNVNKLLRDMSEACMRTVVGDRSINEVISKRAEIASEAQILLQEELNNAETGINIVTIEMKKTNVPIEVRDSFNDVNRAGQEKEKLIYKAKEGYNKAIPAAQGEAEQTISMAEGYALDRINRAKGDAIRFTDLYAEYKNSKDVTRRRLYLEAMKEVFPKISKKYIIDPKQKNILPLLNLESSSNKKKIQIN